MQPVVTLDELRRRLQQVERLAREHFGLELSAEEKGALERTTRLLDAMTDEERMNPDLLMEKNARKRVALASGLGIEDVDGLLSQFAKARILLRNIAENSAWR